MLYVMYHSTVLSKMEMVALDSGRYCTPSPDISFVRDKKDPLDPVYQYRYFLKDSIEYCVQQFLFNGENSEQICAKRRFDEVVLYFKNQEKEACFCIDLEYHPEILDSYLEKEDEPYVFTGKEGLDKQYANNIKISRALKAF